ncbi:MAG: tRNA uridine-5-carboxymethylaminomethyl(34) synthesis enzyme MnmG [bacterium]
MERIVVVGGGHSACEAVWAISRKGVDVLMITLDGSSLGRVSCNPSIGGIAKGHLVYEISAFGGIQPIITDRSSLQYRILNRKKGSVVWGLRAQIDRKMYESKMTDFISRIKNVEIIEDEVIDLIVESRRVRGVITKESGELKCSAVVITTGTFLNGLLYRGDKIWDGGRLGERPSKGLEKFFKREGIKLGRLKTGTPPRLYWSLIDLERLVRQDGEKNILNFNYEFVSQEQLPCYIAKTNKKVNEIIMRNLDRSPLYQGRIKGIGPRYCPSIEDKVVRFSDKVSHTIFLEPEGWNDERCYVNGLSSSLPEDVQNEVVHSIEGLEKAEVASFGYAVEYDYVNPVQLKPSLELKEVEGVFLAGQINGTSGYEEASAQGLMAGINSANKVLGREPLILGRDKAYIGVLIDDLVTKGVDEPYRLFTSRAEWRLNLSQYSAPLRLTDFAFKEGLVNRNRLEFVKNLKKDVKNDIKSLERERHRIDEEVLSGIDYIKRDSNYYEKIFDICDSYRQLLSILVYEENIYEHYRKMMNKMLEEAKWLMVANIDNIDYDKVDGLSRESRERLKSIRPINLDQASRIPGIRPGDIISLIIYRKKMVRSDDKPGVS